MVLRFNLILIKLILLCLTSDFFQGLQLMIIVTPMCNLKLVLLWWWWWWWWCKDFNPFSPKSDQHQFSPKKYQQLVFTKSVDRDFHAFWLAPVTWNILGYSPFWNRIQNHTASHFVTVSKDEILAVNEAAVPTKNEYQKRDKIWVVSDYWICNKIIKNDSKTLSIEM